MKNALTRLLMALVVVIGGLTPALAQTGYDEAIAASATLGADKPADAKDAIETALKGGPVAPSVRALIASNSRALDLLQKAAAAPTVDFNPQKKSVLDRPILKFAVLIDLCALTTIRGGERAKAGDGAKALADFATVLHCSRHLIGDPLQIYKLVGTAIVNGALPTLEANRSLAGLRELVAGCALPTPRAFVEDEKKHFVECVALAATDEPTLGPLLVKHAPAIAGQYFDLLARQVDGDTTADPSAAVDALRASLEKTYGTTVLGSVIEKVKGTADMSDDKKAEVIDSALLLEVFPSIDRPLKMYGKMRAALDALGKPH